MSIREATQSLSALMRRRDLGLPANLDTGARNDQRKKIDIGVALGRGVQILPLPEAWTVVEAVCFVKCLGEDGFPRWALRRSDGINDQELLVS